ncbi:MAG: hypothetical protein ABL893_03810 [Hyphomicrobium sp.]|nr:hypothetical protein [Hyphomicrobium sp.]
MRVPTARILAIMAVAGFAAPAIAEIKDYEVRRFLYLKTPCGIAPIKQITSDAGGLRYKADCPNLTAFPDGAIVECLDPQDDRSCRLVTQSTEFKQLDLMRPQQPDTATPGKEN